MQSTLVESLWLPIVPMHRHGVKAQHRCKASSTLALPSLPRRSAIYYLAAIVHQASGLLIVRPPLVKYGVFHGCSHNPLDSPFSLLIGFDPIFARFEQTTSRAFNQVDPWVSFVCNAVVPSCTNILVTILQVSVGPCAKTCQSFHPSPLICVTF